jgi:hypothetical protein
MLYEATRLINEHVKKNTRFLTFDILKLKVTDLLYNFDMEYNLKYFSRHRFLII